MTTQPTGGADGIRRALAAAPVTARFIARTAPSGFGSNLAVVQRHGLLGARIDGGAVMAAAGDLHPDAEATHDAVCMLGNEVVGQIILHARAGSRPEWIAELPRLVARRRNGKVAMDYWDRERRKPAYCLLEMQPDPALVAMRQAAYLLWWDGLAALAAALVERLSRYQVTGPAALRMPWAPTIGPVVTGPSCAASLCGEDGRASSPVAQFSNEVDRG